MKATIACAISFLVCLQLNLYAQSAKNSKHYIITLKGDTNFYETVEKATIGSGLIGKSNSKKDRYNEKELSGLRMEDHGKILTYERKIFKPEKNSDRTELMELVLEKGNNKLYRYFSTAGAGTYTSTTEIYYLYEGNKFINYIKKDNYVQLFSKYFGSCNEFIQKLKEARFVKLYKLTLEYDLECR